MNISEISKKIDPQSYSELVTFVNEVTFKHEEEKLKVEHTELLKCLINFYSTLEYQNDWLDQKKLDSKDFRFQTFTRIELHTLNYYLSIVGTKNDLENLINECLGLGYSLEMSCNSVSTMREVNLRISFWDRYFYNIEHFIQQMNKHFSFVTDNSARNKQHYFQAMLEKFELGGDCYDTKFILETFTKNFPNENISCLDAISAESNEVSIPYRKFYEYAATLRNSLHNNGFSNKSLNNLDMGLVSLKDIKKGEFINCLSIFHLLVLSIPITHIIEKVVEKSLYLKPEIIYDPFVKELDENSKE